MTHCPICAGTRYVLLAHVSRGMAVWSERKIPCPLCYCAMLGGAR